MTTRQRTVRDIIIVTILTLIGGALAVAAHLSLTSAASATDRADVTASELTTTKAQLRETSATLDGQYDVNAEYADQIADLEDQLADAQQQVRTLTEREPKVVTKEVRVEVPVVKERVKEVRVEVPVVKEVTKQVTKEVPVEVPADAPDVKFYEDGSWTAGDQSGCAPSALCDDAYQDTLDQK